MRRFSLFLALTLAACIASAASAARATSLLDELEAALADIVSVESEQEKPNKKRLRTANIAIKKLGKDTSTPTADLKLLKVVIGKTAKRFAEDVAVTDATADALASADADVVDVIAAARSLIAGAASKKRSKSVQATKLADGAQKKLDQSRTAPNAKKQVARLFIARKKADKALKIAEALPPGDGGGGGEAFFGPDPIARVVYFSLDQQMNVLEFINVRTGETTTISDGTGDLEIRSPAPIASPDGSWIAFKEGTKLRISDGTNIVTMPLDADWERFAFSPDGQRLAATDTDAPLFAVFDLSGQTLVNDPSVVSGRFGDNSFVWTAGSDAVAVRADDGDSTGELRVYDGVGLADVRDVQGTAPFETRIGRLAWTEDGQRLIYVETKLASNRDGELVVVDRAGTERATISLPGEDVSGIGGEYIEERGGTVVYLADVEGQRQLASVGVDGTGHAVFETADDIDEITFIPGGTRVLRIADGALVTSTPDGSEHVTLSTSPKDVYVSESGQTVVFRVGPLPSPAKEGDHPEGAVIFAPPEGTRATLFADPDLGDAKVVQTFTSEDLDPLASRRFVMVATVTDDEEVVFEEQRRLRVFEDGASEQNRDTIARGFENLPIDARIYLQGEFTAVTTRLLLTSDGRYVLRYNAVLFDSSTGKYYACVQDLIVIVTPDTRGFVKSTRFGDRSRGACAEISAFQAAFLGLASGASTE